MSGTPRRRRVALWNAIFGYASLASTLARNILLVPLYLRFVAMGEYGAWLATGGALAQLLVTDYGLAGVIAQRIAVLSGAGDAAAQRRTIQAGLVNAGLLAALLVVLGSLIGLALPATQGLGAAQVSRVVRCFLIAIGASGLGVVAATTTAVLRGLQKPVTAGAITLTADLASIVVTVACLFSDFGLYALAMPLALRSALAAGAGLIALARCIPRRGEGPTSLRADSLALWRQASRFFVTSIAMRLQSQANTLAVGAVLGPQVAATYGLSVRAHETVLIVLWQLNAALGPVLAHLVGAGQRPRLDHIIRNLLPMVAAIAAVGASCTILLNSTFVELWVGEPAFAGLGVTVLMGLALWICALASIGYEALVARGEFSYVARVYASASVLHLILLLALVHLGPWAAPLALSVSTFTWGIVFWRRVLDDMGCSRADMLAVAREPAAIFVLAALATVALAWTLPRIDSWPAFLAEAAVAAAGVGAVLWLARPALRRLMSTELRTTLRALRA